MEIYKDIFHPQNERIIRLPGKMGAGTKDVTTKRAALGNLGNRAVLRPVVPAGKDGTKK